MNHREEEQTCHKSGHDLRTNNGATLNCFLKVPLGCVLWFL